MMISGVPDDCVLAAPHGRVPVMDTLHHGREVLALDPLSWAPTVAQLHSVPAALCASLICLEGKTSSGADFYMVLLPGTRCLCLDGPKPAEELTPTDAMIPGRVRILSVKRLLVFSSHLELRTRKCVCVDIGGLYVYTTEEQEEQNHAAGNNWT